MSLAFKHPSFKNKSIFDPKHVQRGHLDSYINTVRYDLAKQQIQTTKQRNLNIEEYLALKDLKLNTDITIKKADKGLCAVIQNTTDYINEGVKQLSNPKFYRQRTHSLTNHHTKLVNDLIDELLHKESISEETADFLTVSKPRTAAIYFNLKIHKLINLPPGRPIVSANGSCREKISGFVDHFLKDYVETLPSYIRDSTDFINKLRQVQPNANNLLVTIHLTSLYTNIHNVDALRVAKNTLAQNIYHVIAYPPLWTL